MIWLLALKYQMNQIHIQNISGVISLLREEGGSSEKCKDLELYFKGESIFEMYYCWERTTLIFTVLT